MVVTKSRDADAAAKAAGCVVAVHERLVEFLRAGRTLAEIDGFVAKQLEELRCKSAFLGYKAFGCPPFPSHSCLSVNDCIVHGTHLMTRKPLERGDLISIDIGVKHHGWIGDAAWSYAIEEASPEATRLMECGRESLRRGIAALHGGRPLMDWAKAVQAHVVDECGFHLVRDLCGHGYGRKLHEAPSILNSVPRAPHVWPEGSAAAKPGLLIAVEPMIAIGTGNTRQQRGQWPIFTADGSLAVHYEADLMITSNGACDLTAGLDALPDVVG